MKPLRSPTRKVLDFLTFPLRALTLFEHDFGLVSSLASERYDYVRRQVRGECLDVGCGRHNRFVREHLGGRGRGVDVHPYDGVAPGDLLDDPARFPFPDASFGSVTFIANLNHVPRSLRDAELGEAYRCLEPGGRIVVTMGNPIAEVVVHAVVALYDRLLGTHLDVDAERGMREDEEYYLLDSEIAERLARAGFRDLRKKRFWTQWGLNHLLVARKVEGGGG